VALALALGAPGCVTRGKYERAAEDLRRHQERVAELERSNEALGSERVKLLDEMEDLRVAREDLTEDVAKLEKTRQLLEDNLRQREAQVAELSKLSSNYETLVKDLEKEVSSGQIQITQLREGLRLNLAQDVLFRSGSATLEPYGVELLTKVSDELTKYPHMVEVQGHTDDVPLRGALASRWGSNWELAGARAASVVRLFEKQGLDVSRLRAVSYGENAPIADNDTAEGRALNRRIEIRLIPVEEPEKTAASGQAPAADAPPQAETRPTP
jgi:chemotaxis protein MotB